MRRYLHQYGRVWNQIVRIKGVNSVVSRILHPTIFPPPFVANFQIYLFDKIFTPICWRFLQMSPGVSTTFSAVKFNIEGGSSVFYNCIYLSNLLTILFRVPVNNISDRTYSKSVDSLRLKRKALNLMR